MRKWKVGLLYKTEVEAASKEDALQLARDSMKPDDMLVDVVPVAEFGMRVAVYDGGRTKLIGKGVYDSDVPVYFAVNAEEGQMMSKQDPTQEIEEDKIPAGFVVEQRVSPKFILDDGAVLYGCQVWWEVDDEG